MASNGFSCAIVQALCPSSKEHVDSPDVKVTEQVKDTKEVNVEAEGIIDGKIKALTATAL